MSVDIGPVAPSAASPPAGVARAPDQSVDLARPVAESENASNAQRSEGRLNAMLERLTDVGPNFDARLSIDQDDITGTFIYRILNTRTGEVIRQFPDEDRMELLRYLGERQGLVVDQRV